MSNLYLIPVINGQTQEQVPLNSNKKIIGRQANQADIVIPLNFVSREHAAIYMKNGNAYIEDLNSINGVYINSIRIFSAQIIKSGDSITFSKNDISAQILVNNNDTADYPIHKNKTEKRIVDLLNSQSRVSIGRTSENDIVIAKKTVSRTHAYIEKSNSGYIIKDVSTNGTYVNNRLISNECSINENDFISIGSITFTLKDSPSLSSSNNSNFKEFDINKLFKGKTSIEIGRGADCDYVINDKKTSRHHAKIIKEGSNFYIQDLGSINGTFVNGRAVRAKVKIQQADEILIGNFAFTLKGELKNISEELAIKATNITKSYGSNLALKELSLEIPNKAFVALMGPSGCGKSTLLKTLNGDNPASTGNIEIHGYNLKEKYDLLKRKIGYVPQDDIVHPNLTIEESLYYASKLRLTDHISKGNINKQIAEVLKFLN